MNIYRTCKDCKPPIRHVGCHSECEAYKKERDEYEQIRKVIQKEKEKQRIYDYYRIATAEKRGRSAKR